MRFRFAFLVAPLLAALAFTACSKENEGQPCDHNAGNSGNDDCADSLTCQLVSSTNSDYRCCPPNRSQASSSECAISSAVADASPAPPDASTIETSTPDSSTPETSTSEASTAETSTTDAPAEASRDAAAEAGGEGGAAVDASDGSVSDAPAE